MTMFQALAGWRAGGVLAVLLTMPGSMGAAEAQQAARQISVAPDGSEGNDYSEWPAISGNGRFVVFSSKASNLTPGDTNRKWDLFIRNLESGTTSRLDLTFDTADATNLSISDDGEVIAFRSVDHLIGGLPANSCLFSNQYPPERVECHYTYVYERTPQKLTVINPVAPGMAPDRDSGPPKLSGDGRFVLVLSLPRTASNSVTDEWELFRYDRQTNTAMKVSFDEQGRPGPTAEWSSAISRDGHVIAFVTDPRVFESPGVVPEGIFVHERVYVRNLTTGVTRRLDPSPEWPPFLVANASRVSMSADGETVLVS